MACSVGISPPQWGYVIDQVMNRQTAALRKADWNIDYNAFSLQMEHACSLLSTSRIWSMVDGPNLFTILVQTATCKTVRPVPTPNALGGTTFYLFNILVS
jgi:hypothetical protein